MSLQQPQLFGAEDGLGAAVDAEFALEVVEMTFNRTQHHDELGCDLAIREAGSDKMENF